MIIRYKLNSDGQVVRDIVHRSRFRGEARPDRHQSETVLKALYSLECEHKFRSQYSKSTLKKVHETAIQRFEQTGQET